MLVASFVLSAAALLVSLATLALCYLRDTSDPDPGEVITSAGVKEEAPTLEDTLRSRQAEVLGFVRPGYRQAR